MPSASYRPLQPQVVPCRSCGARIFFAHVAKTGKLMPIDVDQAPDGNIVLVDPKTAVVLGPDEAAKEQGRRYQTHFMTCPHAKAWRRARAIPDPPPAHR